MVSDSAEDIWSNDESALSRVFNKYKENNRKITNGGKVLFGAAIISVANLELKNSLSKLKLPKVARSAKGVEGDFSEKGYGYRVDTNKVAPGEGGFHIHIYRDGNEIAKVNGRGGFVQGHKGETLLKPSQLNKTVRNELNKLIRFVQKNLGGD